jgi:hypothetical protein
MHSAGDSTIATDNTDCDRCNSEAFGNESFVPVRCFLLALLVSFPAGMWSEQTALPFDPFVFASAFPRPCSLGPLGKVRVFLDQFFVILTSFWGSEKRRHYL